ncbi:MAG: TetR family transcriptional regulator [Pseudonocardiales bacterium]|nr:TetR family transcriptional regulator [Pseudonocardiales bacterium]
MTTSTTDQLLAPRSARNTREHILRVALEQFAEQGYDGTSLQQIADRLGVTKAALYYHFKSKDDLLLAVLDPYFAGIDDLLKLKDAKPADGKPEQALEQYLDFLLEHRQVLGFLSHDAAALARPAVAARAAALQNLVTEGVAGADLPINDHIKVSFVLGGMQSAISSNASTSAEDLRGPLLESVYLVLRTINPDLQFGTC